MDMQRNKLLNWGYIFKILIINDIISFILHVFFWTFDKHYYEELMLRAWRFRDPENSGGRNFVASEDPQTIVDQMRSMLATEKQDWTWGGGNGENARYG